MPEATIQMPTAADAAWMARALQLAIHGLYTTGVNPRVGCVLVKDSQLIGEGWHDGSAGNVYIRLENMASGYSIKGTNLTGAATGMAAPMTTWIGSANNAFFYDGEIAELTLRPGTGGIFVPGVPVAQVLRIGRDSAPARPLANPDIMDFATVSAAFMPPAPPRAPDTVDPAALPDAAPSAGATPAPAVSPSATAAAVTP